VIERTWHARLARSRQSRAVDPMKRIAIQYGCILALLLGASIAMANPAPRATFAVSPAQPTPKAAANPAPRVILTTDN